MLHPMNSHTRSHAPESSTPGLRRVSGWTRVIGRVHSELPDMARRFARPNSTRQKLSEYRTRDSVPSPEALPDRSRRIAWASTVAKPESAIDLCHPNQSSGSFAIAAALQAVGASCSDLSSASSIMPTTSFIKYLALHPRHVAAFDGLTLLCRISVGRIKV